VTDEPAPDEPQQEPGAAEPERPELTEERRVALFAAVTAANEMYIKDMEEIRDLVDRAEGEDLRDQLSRLSDKMVAGGFTMREILLDFGKIVKEVAQAIGDVKTADFLLDSRHTRAQSALLIRTAELAEAASVEDLCSLTASYSTLIPLWRWERPKQQDSIEPNLED